MSKNKGLAAAKRLQQRAEQRQKARSSSKNFSVWDFMLNSGESAKVRFLGLTGTPFWLDKMLNEEDLSEYSPEDLTEMCLDWGAVCEPAEDLTSEDLIEALKKRAKQVEPHITARHYISRNRGKKPLGLNAMQPCGDQESALAGDWDNTSCEICKARLQGDEGVGWPSTTYCFSVYDYRKVHQIVDGKRKSYESCTMDDEGWCALCEKMTEDNYKLYENGMRKATFSSAVAGLIFQLSNRVSRVCRNCKEGVLRVSEISCPECMESMSPSAVMAYAPGEDADCPKCGANVVFDEDLSCSNCDDPERTRLMDVDVLVSKTGEGRSTAWSFNEGKISALRDLPLEIRSKILGAELPDWEEEFAEPNEEEQLRQIGAPPSASPGPRVGVKDPSKGTVKKMKGRSPFRR